MSRPVIAKKTLRKSVSPAEVKKSPVAVKTEEIISEPFVEEMNALRPIEGICAKYEELGLHWERCKLEWDWATNKKKGVSQNMGKYAEGNGVILHCEGLLAIDIDGDCEKCREIYELCDANCVMKAKTRKGHHFFFKADSRFKQSTGEAVKIDLRTGKPSIVLVEPSFYLHPDGVVQYKWERFPNRMEELTECPKEVCDWLLTDPRYCSDSAPVKKSVMAKVKKPVVKVMKEEKEEEEEDEEVYENQIIMPPSRPSSIVEEVDALCGCLTPEWVGEHTNWLRLMYVMKNISPTDEMKEVFLRHSARAPQFDTPEFRRQNAKAWDGLKQQGRSGIGSLKHWAKKCNPDLYFRLAKDTYWSLLNQDNANGYCEIFYNAMAGDVMYSNSKKCYYVYDDRETLWRECEGNHHMNFLFVEITSAVFRKMAGELPVAKTEEEATQKKAKLKKIQDAQNKCGSAFVITLVNSFLPALCCPFSSEDPSAYFNQNPDLYPLSNGVWKFSEKKLIPYERDHYFTFRVPIAYNPNADTTDIRQASLDWFGQSEKVAEFIQMFVGYCLTGHTTRQEFLIVWGTKAGNGKSLLWGDIMSVLMDKFYATITSDALSTERVGNNDQLYNLNGKRFAFLSEPRRARGAKIDNEIVKTLTGDKFFTAEAKYKNAITFRLQAKFAMACNDMPDIKFDDKGTYRRVKVAEQNCEFIDPADYKEADEEMKTAKKILMKDDDFVKRLVENKEGLMLWALEGANRYIDNPRMEAPNEMDSAKEKAVKEVDRISAWISASIRKLDEVEEKERPEKWKTAKLTFKNIKETMTRQLVQLGQNQQGFNKILKQKLEALGYEVKGREEKGDLYVTKVDYYPDEPADE